MAETSDELLERMLRSTASLSQQQANRLVDEVRHQVESEVRDWLHSAWKAALLRQLADELQQRDPDLAEDARQRAARDSASGDGDGEDIRRGDAPADVAGAEGRQEPTDRVAPLSHDVAPTGKPPAAASIAGTAGRGAADSNDRLAPSAADEHLDAVASDEQPGQYVYGIVLADHPPLPHEVVGVDPDFAVEMLRHKKLQLITSGVSMRDFGPEGWAERVSDLAWVEARLRAHDQVLKTALAHGPLIPLRFGTVTQCSDDLIRLVSADHDRLTETLHRLAGKAEWGVKVTRGEDRGGRAAGQRQLVGAAAAEEGNGSGRAYLQQRQRERQQRRTAREQHAAVARQCHERLAAAACEAVALPAAAPAGQPSGDRDLVLNGSYLLDHSQVDPFGELVSRLAQDHSPSGLSFETTGPWPPYHFVHLELSLDRPR